MYPIQQLLYLDLNYKGTIERSEEFNSLNSLKMLMGYFFENINNNDYYYLIMNDLAILMGKKYIGINDFF